MLPYVFEFPQDPMPGPGGASSGITHGLVYETTFGGFGAYVAFTPGALGTDATGELSDLERFEAHAAVPSQRHGATWAEIEAADGVIADEGKIVSISQTLLAAWVRYRVAAGLPEDPAA